MKEPSALPADSKRAKDEVEDRADPAHLMLTVVSVFTLSTLLQFTWLGGL
jgi:hypothetical protein